MLKLGTLLTEFKPSREDQWVQSMPNDQAHRMLDWGCAWPALVVDMAGVELGKQRKWRKDGKAKKAKTTQT
jgi:hypothetical protein